MNQKLKIKENGSDDDDDGQRERCRAPFNPNKDLNLDNAAPEICKPQAYPMPPIDGIGLWDP